MIGKTFLPKSLFGRALLILALPMVLAQAVMAYMFFNRHWDSVTRRMAGVLAGEASFLVEQVRTTPPGVKPQAVSDFEGATDIAVFLDAPQSFNPGSSGEFRELQEQLRFQIREPLSVRKKDGVIDIRIRLPEQVLRLEAPVKRLESPTTVILMLWTIGASAVFLLIAVLFMRNQIRPIRRLAEAADSFGRGGDMPGFRPQGASEVRKAARAFIVMRERIRRQIRTRTDMLAGISHDLRTPLTRMKLQLAMLSGEAVRELSDDVQQMEHMIQEYLDFARGEGREESARTSVHALLADVVDDYRRLHADVALAVGEDIIMDLKSGGMRRMMHNVIDNAIRYGKRCALTWRRAGSYCEILVDDDGPGIPADKREEVFKPFARLDASRNPKTGGVGLGLTIARDVALAHGGGISLDTSPLGGLRVIIRLPI